MRKIDSGRCVGRSTWRWPGRRRRRRRSSSSSATWSRRTRRRARAPRSSRNWPRSTPTARSRSRSIRTRSSTRTRKSSKRCSSAPCRCWRRRTAKFGPLGVKEFEVFDLPYILPDKATLRKVTEGPLGKKLLKLLEPKGMTGLAYWDNGFKQMSANKKLLMPADYQRPEDPHPVVEGAGGADPRARRDPAGDGVLGSLSGAADRRRRRPGEHPSNMYTQKMHEVQKYITRHRSRLYRLRRHREQEVLGRPAGRHPRAAREGDGGSDRLRQRPVAQKENDDALAEMKKSGKTEIITLTPEQEAAMRKALEPVYTGHGRPRRQGADRRVPEGSQGRDQLRRTLSSFRRHGTEALARPGHGDTCREQCDRCGAVVA